MIGRLKDLTLSRDGNQIISVEISADFSNDYDRLKDNDVDIIVKKHRERRSLDANAYCWVLIDKIADAVNALPEQIYRSAILDIPGNSEIICVKSEAVEKLCEGWNRNGIGWQTETFPSKIGGCTNVKMYYGSSTYDSKQMSILIDRIVEEAKALGIETLTPIEIERLKQIERDAENG